MPALAEPETPPAAQETPLIAEPQALPAAEPDGPVTWIWIGTHQAFDKFIQDEPPLHPPVDFGAARVEHYRMKTLLRLALLLAALTPAMLPLRAADPAPASLAAPADQTLALTLTARGVQIYECRASAGDPARYEWVFKAPEADLFDVHGVKVGRHFAGPTWELAAGGRVAGKVKAKADAPDGKGIPWLLLDAAGASGGGVMGRVRSIRRVDTAGGQPPAEPTGAEQAGREVKVPYTATYEFYAAR